MKDYTEISFKEYLDILKPDHIFNDEVAIVEIDGSNDKYKRPEIYPVKINAFSILITLCGEAIINIDYFDFSVTSNNLIEISRIHIFNGFSFSTDFKGFYIVIPLELLEYNVRLTPPSREVLDYKRSHPVSQMNTAQTSILRDIIERIIVNINRKDHIYQAELIKNDFSNFFMEILDIETKTANIADVDYKISYNESITREFMKLIIENSRTEHNVLFYATQLCLTTTQLSRILKTETGRTAINWINHVQIIESKLLLRKQDLSIQEISEIMNFSDQSAFGKFFKKHTGTSPLEYKNSIRQPKKQIE